MRQTVILREPVSGYRQVCALWKCAKDLLALGQEMVLELRPVKRTDAQNRRMWSMLGDLSKQVTWHGQTLSPEEWKDFFTAGLKRQKMVPGLEGGIVFVGGSFSQMTIKEFADLILLLEPRWPPQTAPLMAGQTAPGRTVGW